MATADKTFSRFGWRGLVSSRKTTAIASFASLGGLICGYNQGLFTQILTMPSFINVTQGYAESPGINQGMLTAILELGAWLGTLFNAYLADGVGRRMTTVLAVAVFCIGCILLACTTNIRFVYAGRFVTGIGIGNLSMIVPLYNAELAPPGIRGSLITIQQLAVTFGIMISYWIGYGTNYIGGTGQSQSIAAWEIPFCIQIAPAVILAVGMLLFMPQSPRHLMNQGREEECLQTLASLRDKSIDDISVRIEYLQIKALHKFEEEVAKEKWPQYQDGSFASRISMTVQEYLSLVKDKPLFKRTTVACLLMVFQQWNGINAIVYYAPQIFRHLDLGTNTISLLATGVVGVVQFISTIPAALFVDKIGRKKFLIVGGIAMTVSHFCVAALLRSYEGSYSAHKNATWAIVAFIWIYSMSFSCSWGPVTWVIVSEIFPLSARAKGVALGSSSKWLNNFAVGLSASPFLAASSCGTFFFFGSITMVGVLYTWLQVPETKDRTLEEMGELFGSDGGAARDAMRKRRIEQEVGLVSLLDYHSKSLKDEKLAAQRV